MQSPQEFSKVLREMIASQLKATDDATEDGIKTYTNKEHLKDRLEFLLKYADIFDNVIKNCALQIYAVYEDETEIDIQGYKCTQQVIEDLVIISTPDGLSDVDLQDLSTGINDLQKKNAFGNKIITIMPYSVKCLRARVSKPKEAKVRVASSKIPNISDDDMQIIHDLNPFVEEKYNFKDPLNNKYHSPFPPTTTPYEKYVDNGGSVSVIENKDNGGSNRMKFNDWATSGRHD